MKEQNKIFTLPVVNWIISIFVGCVIPVISQTFLAQSITSLNNTPSIEPQTTYPTWLAITILWATITTYTIALSYMIWFIAKTQTHNSVWALIIFLISPITIWAILPLLLGA